MTTFTWFHPRFQNHRYPRFHVEPRGGTVAWRLEGDLFDRLHRHHRRAARKAEEHVETRITVAPPDLGSFASLYERTMAEKDATGFYYFPAEYWEALAGHEWLVLFEAVSGHGVTAALLGLASKPWLHYHLGASERSEAARTTSSSWKPPDGRRPRATSASTSAAASAARTTRCSSSSFASTRAG